MIRKIISSQKAANLVLVFTGLLIVFHLLVIIGVFPFHQLWTELADPAAVLPLELITIVANLSFGLIVLIKMKYLERGESSVVLNIGMYLVALILITRTAIKFMSPAIVDHFVLAPVLLLMALLTIRLAIEH
ncbi:MAG: hypothetical protein JXR22_00605 [Prolixibacteraceae bacterium]|nr:hypothetical protein [Prolixibacteraceae bacterium]